MFPKPVKMSWLTNLYHLNPRVILVSIIIVGLIQDVQSAPAPSASADPNEEAIKKAVEALAETSFLGDQQLVQNADRVNGLSSYRHPEGEKNGKTVFLRKKSDAGQKVVVMGTEDDQLKHSSAKRTYVVLKQNPTDPKLYRVFYAYVRDAKADEASAISIGGKKRLIEFDTWDARGSSKNIQRSFGWTTCFESVYPPCKNNLVDMVQVEKSESGEVEYNVEEDDSPIPSNSSNPVNKPIRIIDTNMISVPGIDVPSYYDFFVDLDETTVGVDYIVKTVGTYTYSLSAATAASPPETLLLAGIRPTDPEPGRANEVAAMKSEDMKSAIVLFKQINNDTSPLQIENIPVIRPTNGNLGRSADKVDMERFKRLKEQNEAVIEKLESLSKLYPVKDAKIDETKLQFKGTESPNQQLNLFKSYAVKLLSKISEKGLPILEGILEQSEVGQELKDNPEEGQDLLNEQDLQVLIDAEEEYATVPPATTGDQSAAPTSEKDDEKILDEKKKVKELLLEKIRKAKKEQRSLKKVTKKIKAKSEALKSESPRKGGLLSGGLLKILLDFQNGRSVAPTGRGVDPDPLMSLMGSMISGEGGLGGGGIMGALMGDVVGSSLLSNLMEPAMAALGKDGKINYFKLITGVGGSLVHTGISKIPLVGGPLSMLSGMFGSVAKTTAGFLGFGRSISDLGQQEESSSKTNLFGHMGWRSSEINPEELAVASPNAEEGSPFTGFGSCPRKPATHAEFENSKTLEEIVRLYTTLLKTQCSQMQKRKISALLTSELLSLNEDKSLSLNPISPLLTNQKLQKSEESDLSLAFELSMFSHALIAEWKYPSDPSNPDGSKITPTVHTFIKAALNGITEGRKQVPLHFIKLARNSGISLKTGFTKLLQDYDRYKACSKCAGQILETAKSDLLGITGVMQFIIAGLGPVDQGTKNASEAYKEFFILNKAALADKVKPFL